MNDREQWIPVNVVLPHRTGEYLICTKQGEVGACHFYVGEMSGWDTDQNRVTHWMPLPAAPKSIEKAITEPPEPRRRKS